MLFNVREVEAADSVRHRWIAAANHNVGTYNNNQQWAL